MGKAMVVRRALKPASVLLLVFGLNANSVAAESRPKQLLIMPWELPARSLVSDQIGLDANSLELPDGRHTELYRLTLYHAIGSRHFARFTQDYAGIQSEDRFQWGGGRTEVQWSSRLGPADGRRVVIEGVGSLSTGDEKLHPLSAGAPSLQMRWRVQWLSAGGLELWTGALLRLVSPPSEGDRQAPRSSFPSGRAWDATLRWSRGRWDSQLALRYDQGGLPRSWWSSWITSVPLGEQIGLRLGGHVGWGPVGSRLIDQGWTLGVSWQPPLALSSTAQLR